MGYQNKNKIIFMKNLLRPYEDSFYTNQKTERFYCLPKISLFEYYTGFRGLPRGRLDILKLLQIYFEGDPKEKEEILKEARNIFRIVDVSWTVLSEETSHPRVVIKKGKFPFLDSLKIIYYDQWQAAFIQELVNNFVPEAAHLSILHQALSFELARICHREIVLTDALRALKMHATMENGSSPTEGIKQEGFLFFSDYLKELTASADNLIRFKLLPAEEQHEYTKSTTVQGLGTATRKWINMKSKHGMGWEEIVDYINQREHSMASTLMQEEEHKGHTREKETYPEEKSENIRDEPAYISGDVYCTHHRVKTHSTKECNALLKKKPQKSDCIEDGLGSTGQKGCDKLYFSLILESAGMNLPVKSKIPVAQGRINGTECEFVLNAGSDINIISERARERMNLHEIVQETGRRVVYTVYGAQEIDAKYVSAIVQLGAQMENISKQKFLIIPNADVLIILGMAWIKSNYNFYVSSLVPLNRMLSVSSALKKKADNLCPNEGHGTGQF